VRSQPESKRKGRARRYRTAPRRQPFQTVFGMPIAIPIDRKMEHRMSLEDLNCRYQDLRDALERAYLAPVWDSAHIDQLTEDIRSVELALGMLQVRQANDPEPMSG
jgi:hypothetical protein